MVLNELVGSTTYQIIDLGNVNGDASFKATIIIDNYEHVGLGKSKALAKCNAAEAAIKHLVVKKVQSSVTAPPGTEKMEVDQEDDNFSWSHIASFALHKLFNSWDEPGIKDKICGTSSPIAKVSGGGQSNQTEHKPAKKLPDKPEEMNPITLLNQMKPSATFEEISKIGNPPNVKFTFQVVVDGQNYCGCGKNLLIFLR